MSLGHGARPANDGGNAKTRVEQSAFGPERHLGRGIRTGQRLDEGYDLRIGGGIETGIPVHDLNHNAAAFRAGFRNCFCGGLDASQQDLRIVGLQVADFEIDAAMVRHDVQRRPTANDPGMDR